MLSLTGWEIDRQCRRIEQLLLPANPIINCYGTDNWSSGPKPDEVDTEEGPAGCK